MGCKPCPHHCPSGSGGPVAVLAVLAVIVIAASGRTVASGAEVVLHIVLITVAITAGLAVTAALVYAAFRVRRWRAARRRAMPEYRLSARTAQPLSTPQARAVEAPGRQIGPVDITSSVRDPIRVHLRR